MLEMLRAELWDVQDLGWIGGGRSALDPEGEELDRDGSSGRHAGWDRRDGSGRVAGAAGEAVERAGAALLLVAVRAFAAVVRGHEREGVRERGLGAEQREHDDGEQPEQAPELAHLRGLSSSNHHRLVFLIAVLGLFVKPVAS